MRGTIDSLVMLCVSTFSMAAIGGTPPSNAPPPPDPKVVAVYGEFDYGDGEVFWRDSIRILSNGSLGLDDELFFLKFCPVSSAIICIHGVNYDYDFAIPRHQLAIGDTWSFNGKTFKLISSEQFAGGVGLVPKSEKTMSETTLFGQKLSFYVVALLGGKGKYPEHLFFYSIDRGLIGDAAPTEDRNLAPNWLAEAVGPGSKQFDSKIDSEAFLSQDELNKLLNGHVEFGK